MLLLHLSYKLAMTRSSERFVSLSAKFAVFGIMLAVASMIGVYSVINGFKEEVYSLIEDQGSQVLLTDLWDQDLASFSETLEDLYFVNHAWSYQQGYGLLKSVKAFYPVLITSSSDQVGDGVWVEQKMSDSYQVGESMSILLPGQSARPQQLTLPIEGVFSIALPLPRGLWHVQISSDQFTQLGLIEHAKGIVVEISKSSDAYLLRDFLSQSEIQLFTISDWISRYEPMLEALSMQQHAMMMILLLIVIVSLFSLVSGLMMMVSQQAKQFAMLSLLGLSRRSSAMLMLLQGMMMSVIGTMLGYALGYIVSMNAPNAVMLIEAYSGITLLHKSVYGVSQLPVAISHQANLVIALCSILLGTFASIIPSMKLMKQNPAEVLRNA
ncbi:FtsX-like permease family protein [Gammaproteobacteria bacterium]|nr:FtsX-like permease family protein [Gammaproteobacteria bacterium]